MKPLILLSTSRHVRETRLPGLPLLGAVLADDYATGIEAAGGIPLLVPYVNEFQTVYSLAERVDGLVLTGGEDLDPHLFGEEPVYGLGNVTPERDAIELQLVRIFHELNKPIFGICRGIQVLNVAFGGTIYQDLARQWRGRIQHSQKAPRTHLSHRVIVQADTELCDIVGATEISVNSFHHQSVRKVAPNLRVSAVDSEGLVEAIEAADPSQFILGVQWHPENLWRDRPEALRLFQRFVERAGR